MLRPPTYTPELKTEVLKELMFNIAVTREITSKYGVPPSQVRRWIRETVARLDQVFEEKNPVTPPESLQEASRLSAGELDLLLNNYDRINASQ